MKGNDLLRQAELRALRVVAEDIVGKIASSLDGQTDEKLMPQYGISYNTWRKVRAGEPIRKSVAERLEARVATKVR